MQLITSRVFVCVCFTLFLFTIHVQAQDNNTKNKLLHVKGTIQDTSGNKIPNAIIYVYGDTIHTDSTGHFNMKVARGDSVIIKAKGYYPIGYRPKSDSSNITMLSLPIDTSTTASNLKRRDTLNKTPLIKNDSSSKDTTQQNPIVKKNDSIELQPILATSNKKNSFGEGKLEDIVIVGYGTQRRKDVTGSLATIYGADLANRPTTNTISALQGVSPGLIVNRSSGQPGQEGYTLQTRGYTSVNGGNLLGLVDGVNGDITAINPYDIESVTVLKDASAAAIYGARAAGGVLLLTTKKGKKGFRVSYNTIFGMQKSVDRPNRLNSWQEAQMANEASLNAGQNPLYTQQQIGWMKSSDSNYVISPTDPSNYDYYYNLNQIPLLIKNSSSSTMQNLTFSGASETDNYYFSLGYYDQNGLFKFGPDNKSKI